jgi:hypothetical protein
LHILDKPEISDFWIATTAGLYEKAAKASYIAGEATSPSSPGGGGG